MNQPFLYMRRSALMFVPLAIFAFCIILTISPTAFAAPAAQEPVPGVPRFDVHLPLVTNRSATTPPPTNIAHIQVATADGLQTLNGRIVTTATLVVHVDFQTVVEDVAITLQQGNDSATDVTAQFATAATAGATSGTATGTLTLSSGDYALTVTGTVSGTMHSQRARWQVFMAPMLAAASTVAYSSTVSLDFALPHEALTVFILFTDTATIDDMTAVYQTHNVIPLDLDLNLRMARVQIDNGMTPAAKAAELRAVPIVEAATPNIDLSERAAVGETMPARLTNSYRASAGATCTGNGANRGCFDHSGNADDELARFRYHFFIDTFAMHRLVNHLVPRRTVSPTIAVLDSGVSIAGANPLDIPAADFVSITAMPTRYNVSGQPVNALGNPLNLALAAVADGSGHGTAVTAAAAGRGTTTLGTGVHALVRPVRRGNRLNHDIAAMSMVALDSSVVAVNGSFGVDLDIREPYNDVNGDGFYTYIDNDGSGTYNAGDGGEPYLDLSGNGLWTGRDGMVSAWERTYFRNTIIPAIAPFYRRGFQRLRQPYFDRNGSRTYDAGEPYADTNGNGRYDGAGDGKIYVIAAGNNGVAIGNESYPERLAPSARRTANDYLLLAISSVETARRIQGGEQLSAFSQFGPQISVAAAGGNTLLPNHTGALNAINGNSFAAPVVSGLVGEMAYLDYHTNGPASRLSPLQYIELIEATADDLGTNVAANSVSRANNTPGDGFDNFFGHGRINAWKAILAVINRGIAAESHLTASRSPAVGFPSLTTINEANTQWYGFKIHSPIHNATVWIDGVRVVDAGSTAPSNNIATYAGVRTDQTILMGIDDDNDRKLDEDPTTGVVPMGSQSNFVATFSVQRSDLTPVAERKRTLSLRRPGQTADDDPFFNLEIDLTAMRNGDVPGVIFDDFVFEIVPPDFGDVVMQVKHNDAHHVHGGLEWLGGGSFNVFEGTSIEHGALDIADTDGISNWSLDPNSLFLDDMDWYDNGVTLYPLTYKAGGRGRADLEVCVAQIGSRYSITDTNKQIYINAWFDWNTNESWEEGATKEHVVNGLRLAPVTADDAGWAVRGVITNTTNTTVAFKEQVGNCGRYEVAFDVAGALGTGDLTTRWRLDYGENSGQYTNTTFVHLPGLTLAAGPARYGEVEDYLIGSDFGDAPDAEYVGTPKNHPTKLASNGARHLSFFREWLGPYSSAKPTASREPDACKTNSSDQDGADNIGDQCTAADGDALDNFRVSSPEPGKVQVDFEISTAVRGFGFRGGNGGVSTLKPDCTLGPIATTPATPNHQRADMRYYAGFAVDRPYVSIYADWDGDGTFETTLLEPSPADPEDFGADGSYTLGEPFIDTNKDGTWTPGEAYTDAAGTPTRVFSCIFPAPLPLPTAALRWLRIRVDYGEKAGQQTLVLQPYAEAPAATLSGPTGGAVWGEVEDRPIGGIPPVKVSTPETVIPGQEFHYAITLTGNPLLAETARGQMDDPLPDLTEYVGNLACSSGTCTYDAEAHEVRWSGDLTADQVVTIEFDGRVPEEVPADWPEIVNRVRVFDGLIAAAAEARTQIQCVPTKRPSTPLVEPGQKFGYTITLPAAPDATGSVDAEIIDPLPAVLQFQGDLICSAPGECLYDDAEHAVIWRGALPPETEVSVSFSTAVRTDIPPEECPPTVVNEAIINRGTVGQLATGSVSVACAAPGQ